MDRNMITVMSGQVVDSYDNDFRELYAISDKLDLFKEFHLSRPQTGTLARAAVAKRPVTATSRFQVNLGDTARGGVPAHKYHNPKYLLALGQIPGPSAPLQEFLDTMELPAAGQQGPEEHLDNPTPVPSQSGANESQKPQQTNKKKRWRLTFRKKPKIKNDSVSEELNPTHTNPTDHTTKQTHTTDENSKTNDPSVKKNKRRFNLFKKAK